MDNSLVPNRQYEKICSLKVLILVVMDNSLVRVVNIKIFTNASFES